MELVRRADVLSDDELVAELRRRGRELMDVEPVSWPVVIGWLRAEAAAAAADPEWAGGQDHPDALDRVADQLDELLTAAEVYVEHVRNAGGGQVPGPGTSKLEALEAAIDPGSGVPRGTSVRSGPTDFSTRDEAPTARFEVLVDPMAPPGMIYGMPADDPYVEELRANQPRTCVALPGGKNRNQQCGAPVDPDTEGDLCPKHDQEAADIGRQVVGLLTAIRYSGR